MLDQGKLQIQSFRVCFQLERRLHKIDRWRLPFPHGIPLRGIGHAVAIVVVIAVVGSMPLFGALLNVVPFEVRYLVAPIAGAWLLSLWKVDGRSAPSVGLSYIRMRLRPQRLVSFRAQPETATVRWTRIAVAPDERGPRLRPGVISGPATVLVRYPAELQARGRRLHVRQTADEPLWQGKQIRLQPDQRVVVE